MFLFEKSFFFVNSMFGKRIHPYFPETVSAFDKCNDWSRLDVSGKQYPIATEFH